MVFNSYLYPWFSIALFSFYLGRLPNLCGPNPDRVVFRHVQDASIKENQLVAAGFDPLSSVIVIGTFGLSLPLADD